MNFDERLQAFIDGLNEKRLGYLQENYPRNDHADSTCSVSIHKQSKFAKIIEGRGSVYAFVALENGQNKQLGAYRQGDVFKPASWKAPAKHPRGNIFDDDNGLTCCGPYGVQYLK